MFKAASLAFLFLLAACGSTKSASTPCAGNHVGNWASTSATINFADTCTFAFTGSGCASAGTYPAPLGTSGQVAITIASKTGGAACLGVGSYTCAYTLSSTSLAFDCGAGAASYTKQ